MIHPEPRKNGKVSAVVNDSKGFVAHSFAGNAPLYELIRKHEPEGGVLLIVGIFCCGGLNARKNINEFVALEG